MGVKLGFSPEQIEAVFLLVTNEAYAADLIRRYDEAVEIYKRQLAEMN